MAMDKYTGEGYLSTPLNELRPYIDPGSEAYKYFEQLEYNVNELNRLINIFKAQLKEGCMLLQEGRIVWSNDIVTVLTGYKLEELAGKAVVELTVPGMREKLDARMKLLLAGDPGSFPQEWPLLKADRTVIYVNIFAYRVVFLSSPAILLFFYDVTAQKKIMEEQRMRAEMLDSINDSVFLMDLTGNILYVNEALCAATDYSREELLEMNVLDITAPEMRKRFDIRMKQFSLHKEARFSSIVLRKNGERIKAEIRGKIIIINGRQCVIGVARAVRLDAEADIDLL